MSVMQKTKEKLKIAFSAARKWVKTTHEKLSPHPIFHVGIISAVLVFLVEILSRHSLWSAICFLVLTPHVFIYNALIIALTLTPAFLFKKKDFMLMLVSFVWLLLGIANCAVLANRVTPLGAVDIALLDSVSDIINRYLTAWQLVLIAIGILALVAFIVYIWIKAPKRKVSYIRSAAALVIMALLTFGATELSLSASAVTRELGNLAEAYNKYGFTYCFSASLVDRGIPKPDEYSEENMNKILNSLPKERDPEQYPNIVFVQLESFFDVDYLKTLEVSSDPIPNFRKIKEEGLSGFLTVPSIGAGTANTEFEIISGMRIYDFGTGEYPYKTILQTNACETVNTFLKSRGLACHAIHNHTGNFYDRNEVYKSLGFDTFISIEYMNGVEYNILDWAKDDVLTSQVLSALDSTEGSDFVYTVSVQAHGKYPTTPITENEITITGFADEGQEIGFEYFVNQLYETDAFVGELMAELEARQEPTVLVLFGDHLPTFNIEEEDLENENLFQTEYAIWSNIPLEAENKRNDLIAYQLYSYVLDCIGSSGGIVSRLHQNGSSPEDLLFVEYDMLYGENYALGAPMKPSDMKMGVVDIIAEDCYINEGFFYVTGSNFTPFSRIMIDGDHVKTEFIDTNTVRCSKLPSSKDPIKVVQYTHSKREVLSESNEIIFQKS